MAYAIDFAELKQRVTIEDVLNILGIEMKRSGDQLRSACPLHEGSDTRQFVVSPARGLWRCFGKCNEGGDQLTLAAKVWNCDLKTAATRLAQHLHNGVKQAPTAPRDFSHVAHQLDPNNPLLEPLNVDAEALQHFGAGWRGKGFGTGRLLIPVQNREGKLLGYAARAIKPNQQELYLWPKDLDGDGLLFNAHRIQPGELTFFTDPLKVMVAWQQDIQAVASFGPPTPATLKLLADLLQHHKIESIEIL